MSTPAAKRIRLDSSTTVHKPFKSPYRIPSIKQTSEKQAHVQTDTIKTSTLIPYKSCTPARSRYSENNQAPSTSRFIASGSPISHHELSVDPLIAPLLKAQRALEQQIREVKEQLETAEQARKIEQVSRVNFNEQLDGDLKGLIEKWRHISQQACEELFGGVRQKIDSMGGPRAWRRAEKESHSFCWAHDGDLLSLQAESNPENEEKTDDGGYHTKYIEESETQNEREARTGDVPEDDTPEDEFNMGTMLKMMNVDIDIIAYDWVAQGWKE